MIHFDEEEVITMNEASRRLPKRNGKFRRFPAVIIVTCGGITEVNTTGEDGESEDQED
ncbi:MAG: hypothetical protein ACYTHM_08490 [Planctomycetota bacterium]|jgi:hypothetical protein